MIYRPEVDGLRALAVLPVILFHIGVAGFGGGYVGVDLFFVISGYLITSILLEEHAVGHFSVAMFYERRARRILPALFVVMAACLPLAWFTLLPDEMLAFVHSVMAVLVFSSNLLFWQESGYFQAASELKPLLHTWSLAVEEQYYVVFPVLLAWWWRWRRGELRHWWLALALISLAVAEWGVRHQPAATFYLLPARAWELLVGAWCADRLNRAPACVRSPWDQVLSLLGLAAIGLSMAWFDRRTPFPGLHAAGPVLGAALLILHARAHTWVGRALAHPVPVSLGLLSYSAYLWHQPLLAGLRLSAHWPDQLAGQLSLVALTFALAWLSWRWVETPVRKRQWLGHRRSLTLGCVGVSALFMLWAMLGQWQHGWPTRFEPAVAQRLAEIDRLHQSRETLIQAGHCHFNAEVNTAGVDDFLRQWDCRPGVADHLQPMGLAIVGDSHSADKVLAFRLNGRSPMQLGGAGCALAPSRMSPDCRRLFEHALTTIQQTPAVTHLALAQRWDHAQDLAPELIEEAVQFWSRAGKPLIWFTGMPTYPLYRRHVALQQALTPDQSLSLQSEGPRVMAVLSRHQVHVVNTRQLLCSLAADCGHQAADGALLLTDPNHLSPEGARRLGLALLTQDPVLRGLASPPSPSHPQISSTLRTNDPNGAYRHMQATDRVPHIGMSSSEISSRARQEGNT